MFADLSVRRDGSGGDLPYLTLLVQRPREARSKLPEVVPFSNWLVASGRPPSRGAIREISPFRCIRFPFRLWARPSQRWACRVVMSSTPLAARDP